jgi:hypothetical protein
MLSLGASRQQVWRLPPRKPGNCVHVVPKKGLHKRVLDYCILRGEPAHKAFGVPTDKVLEVGLIYTI